MMEDLSRARQLPPEEIAAMRERFKEAERQMDETLERIKQEEAEKAASSKEMP